jgi:hypothetical protein
MHIKIWLEKLEERNSFEDPGAGERIILTFRNHPSHIQDGRTATLQMLHYIYFFSTNISTQYFKHAAHSLFFSSKCHLFHNATFFGSCIIHILHTRRAKI